LCSCLQKVP